MYLLKRRDRALVKMSKNRITKHLIYAALEALGTNAIEWLELADAGRVLLTTKTALAVCGFAKINDLVSRSGMLVP
jgi:hypothetical protein